MKIISIVGTRPQFLKLAPLHKAFIKSNINHQIIHSGQHYDKEMSEQLFHCLELPEPHHLLSLKGSSPIQKFSEMIVAMENILIADKPNKLLVYGDCDTTLAGALVAKKLKIPLIHIESGMRSYNGDMPEEQNRVMVDHISDMLICSTQDSVENAKKENIKTPIHFVGNLQLDLLQLCLESYNNTQILDENNLEENKFALLTIHREYNTTPDALAQLFNHLSKVNTKVFFPIHPRTKNVIEKNGIELPQNLIIVKPVNYLDMTILERYCQFIITDSGGVQPEAWYLRKKCIVMRSETEWIEPLQNNNNILYDFKTPLNEFISDFLQKEITEKNYSENASENIVKLFSN